MAVTLKSSGTTTVTTGSECTLATVSDAGVYTFHIDTNALTSTDVLECRIYQVVITGSTSRCAYYMPFYGTQTSTDKIKISVPVGNDLAEAGALTFTVLQSYGTARAYPWKVLSY